jgi:hypothetical protein
MPKLVDLIGQRFGRLLVIEPHYSSKYKRVLWLCQCECGKEKIVLGYNLKSGNTQSCGCLGKEGNHAIHGHHRRGKATREYKSWASMKERCTNPNHKYWKNYGGRGITVCKKWMEFSNFLMDMGERPSGCTLERIKNEKGYFKKNCYWATRNQQQRNTRRNLYVSYAGERWLFIELCEKFNMPRQLVYGRYYGLYWTLEEALITTVGEKRKRND